MKILAPVDVVTAVIGFLDGYGLNAAGVVPADRSAGMIRVTRVGGGPINALQDHAQVLVEYWGQDQTTSFDETMVLWSLFAAVSTDDQEAFPGIVCYRCEPSFPVQMPDDYAPELDRHQLTLTMITRMEEREITIHGHEEDAGGDSGE